MLLKSYAIYYKHPNYTSKEQKKFKNRGFIIEYNNKDFLTLKCFNK
jgi:hypothetical protein